MSKNELIEKARQAHSSSPIQEGVVVWGGPKHNVLGKVTKVEFWKNFPHVMVEIEHGESIGLRGVSIYNVKDCEIFEEVVGA